MAQIIVRNLDDKVIALLKRRAKEKRVSLEQHVRDVLAETAHPSRTEIIAEIDRIRESIGPVPGDSTAVIREWRDRGWSDR